MRVTRNSLLVIAYPEPTPTGSLVPPGRNVSTAFKVMCRLNQASGASTLADCRLHAACFVLLVMEIRQLFLLVDPSLADRSHVVRGQRDELTALFMPSLFNPWVITITGDHS